jgi:TrmH family RNA methyltransferase
VPPVTSRHNPIVARYRAAARGEDRSLMLLDGAHLVADALDAGVALHDVVIASGAESREDVAGLVARLERHRVSFVSASAAVMAAVSPVRSSSPIVALAQRPANDGARVYSASAPFVVIAADVQDPGNVGAIVRAAEAAGASGVIAAGATADPFSWKALRGAMGSALRLPVVAERDLAHAVADARAHGCRIVATAPRSGRSLFDCRFTGATAVLVGSEGPGLPSSVVADADERVTIPMEAPVESLNAAVTAALILYEARRQRSHETHENAKEVSR